MALSGECDDAFPFLASEPALKPAADQSRRCCRVPLRTHVARPARIFRGIDFTLRDGPGAVVLVAPERTAGVNEQNLELASAFSVGQNAGAQRRSLGNLCQRCHIDSI